MPERLVHLGVGNFHRAHQAWYTHKANEAAGSAWKINGISLLRPDTRDALKPQGYAYTLETQGAGEPGYERLKVLENILVAPRELGETLEALADPSCSVISLTVTEKGYHLKASDRRLNLEDPGIRADLDSERPKTTLGILFAGLALRKDRGGQGLSLLSCDNLPGNGALLKQALLDYAAAAHRADLNAWLERELAFPSSMVDRIVPATTPEMRARVKAATGRDEAWPVMAEEFSQWVLEDRFAGPRPVWEKAGVEFVPDSGPYELRKLRMLNGAHSALAYFGLLGGKAYVYEAARDLSLMQKARELMAEAAGTLPDSVKGSAPAYAKQLEKRFDNPGLKHSLKQIAMDGSQKLPIRLIGPLCERLALDKASPAMEAVLAAWTAFVARESAKGAPINDPLAPRLAEVFRKAGSAKAMTEALMELEFFGPLHKADPEAGKRIMSLAAGLLAQ